MYNNQIISTCCKMPMPQINKTTGLRWSQVAFYAILIALGLIVAIPLSQCTMDFSGNCILFTKLVYKTSHNIENGTTLNMQSLSMEWAPIDICWYCTYLSVFISIYAVIWGWFFVLYSGTDITYWSRIRLLIGSVVMDGVIFICSFVASLRISFGFAVWCNSVPQGNRSPTPVPYTCQQISEFKWDVPNGERFYVNITIAQIASWITTFVFGVLVITSISKIYTYIYKPHLLSESVTESNRKDTVLTIDNPMYDLEQQSTTKKSPKKEKLDKQALVEHDQLAENYGTIDDVKTKGSVEKPENIAASSKALNDVEMVKETDAIVHDTGTGGHGPKPNESDC
ncbi:unnamed protein product [Owenia fusiformis]|uniref:Uncharacterized protein n=1 Tax=Owenia fusiformis TaxID=6347 RepID=A0A8J1U3D9_OWEFU|nr:unnamed protein product [Owenia fusiformis]